MLRKTLIAIALLVAALGLLAYAALRDNPARPAVGERRVVTSGAAEIHYFAGGPDAAPLTVALVPSYARSAADFNELVAALNAAGYRTLAMQPRGIDGSGMPSVQASLHTYASDLAAVVAAEAPDERVVAIGHAYGNRVARTFAADFPQRVAALVLLAAGGAEPSPPETTDAISTAMFGIWPEASRRKAIDFAFFAEGNAVPDDWMRGWYPLAGLAQANATATTPYAQWGGGGRAPILVIEPAEDAIAGGAGEELRRRFPERVRVIEIEGAGHALLPEQPERVHAAVLAYLRSL